MDSTKLVGLSCNTPGRGACRPVSAWRTRCGCPTGRRRRTTPRWCRLRCSCSIPRRRQREVGEVESGNDDTADQTRLVVAGAGPLPMARRHNELGLFSGEDVSAEQMRCGAFLFGSDL